ncbi:MAG: hypothetical protein K2L46_07060 [Paramuribaculum sp.]|nr:hypothetical protein [Paramuribaculum sp.]MDE6489023.1 hypothetical protein [Paramuribaculum sp.]
MASLLWFNPENDLALAAGTSQYTPPRAAIALRRAGAYLPRLWAGDSDVILTDLSATVDPTLHPRPWGWSSFTSSVFRRCGIAGENLPAPDRIQQMRQLSHRRSASRLLQLIGYPDRLIPVESFSIEQAIETIAGFGGKAFIKLPWSCSGRGVIDSGNLPLHKLREVVSGMISRQGSVMVEPRYNRIRDFATLFHAENGHVRFRGLSLFSTDSGGHYSGNIVAHQSKIEAAVATDLSALIPTLEKALEQIYGDCYDGWLGIDMLIHADTYGRRQLAPCIEINMRMTMGVAALLAAGSPINPWDEAILHVAMPGETLHRNAITFSAVPPLPGIPLTYPVITLSPASD